MAKVDFRLPDDFRAKLSHLGKDTDSVAEKVLEAGGKVVLAKVKSNLAAAIGSGTKDVSRSTGELVQSLGLSPVKLNREANHDIKIGFSEPRSDGSSNAKIANILEYGKHGQPAKPFLKPAKSAVKTACIRAMEQVLMEELEKL